jgi:ADP-dependent NAD(P)H-hydrate dehydratase / NAD(P)H-hydrate epimerase
MALARQELIMKIFSAAQIRQWDAYTIEHTHILSIDLMENAATACSNWLTTHYDRENKFAVFCGTGNNGGDGLAIARLLISNGYSVKTFIINKGEPVPDFNTNLKRLQEITNSIGFINTAEELLVTEKDTIIIESIFGTGINRPVTGIHATAIERINKSACTIVSIDMPAGLYAGKSSIGNTIVKATCTLSFGCYKLAFLLAENEQFTGEVVILDIGLLESFAEKESTAFTITEKKDIQALIKPRRKHSHKGNFGKALIAGGSNGKMGAMVLSADACLRSGAGLLTVAIPATGDIILQTAVPEAMTITETLTSELLQQFSAIGAGPGWGTLQNTQEQLQFILNHFHQPMVLDADALNCLSLNKNWLSNLPANSILTPHPKEFERLFGSSGNDFERLQLAVQKASALNIIIVLKGHYTAVVTPDGNIHFNSTGNPGMATGGSGDVLTGIITGLLAQGYNSKDAAVMGLYLHGFAGDIAAAKNSEQGMKAGDIINSLGNAWLEIINNQ